MNRRLFALALALLVPLMALAPLARAEDKQSASATGTIAVFKLDGPVTESPADEMAAIFGGEKGVSLKDLVPVVRSYRIADGNITEEPVVLEGK